LNGDRSGLAPDAVCRLTVFIRQSDLYHHRPLYSEIVHRAHQAGLSGASAFCGLLGFSAHDPARPGRPRGRPDVPVLIVIVDAEDRVRSFLPVLDELVGSGIAVIDHTEVVG
jgi:PII-like signaling protein